MSEQFTIDANVRTNVGKKVKQLRREGLIPAVVYGQREAISIQVDNLEMRRILRHAGSNDLITINIEGDTRTALVRDYQRHPVRGEVLHIDFYEVNMAETLTTEVTLSMFGISPPVEDGLGTVTQMLHALEIECKPADLVSEITFDMGMIQTPDDSIYVSELTIPEGITVLTDPEILVATFEYTQMPEEEGEEEEESFLPSADEVEVIGRGKAEDEDEEASL
jgi:large subunit ribosomal protein L25